MGSRDRLFSIYGEAWGGWPPAAMTLEQDRDDLAHHEREIAAHESFNYALLDAAEAELLGCVYIDPPRDPDVDGEAAVSWWVVDALVGSPVERALDDLVPRWLAGSWPFEIGRASGGGRVLRYVSILVGGGSLK